MGEKLDPEVKALLDARMARRKGKSPHGATAEDVAWAKAEVARRKGAMAPTPPAAEPTATAVEEDAPKSKKKAALWP